MAGVISELKEHSIILAIMGESYQQSIKEMVEEVQKEYKKICYITVNKPYIALTQMLKENKADPSKILFIDAITKTVMRPKTADNCIFISSPAALTELSITVTKTCKNYQPELVFIDSLSSFLVYEKGPPLVKFSHSLINGFRQYGTKAIMVILQEDYDDSLLKDLKMFVDKVIKV